MFCPNCCCEYIGLKRKCPSCQTPMTTIKSYISQPEMPAISYNDLIELVKNNMDDSVIPKLKVAYRKLDREEYQVIWPENFQGEFKVI